MRRAAWLAALACCGLLSLAGCARRLESFQFDAAGRDGIDLLQQRGTGPIDRTVFRAPADTTTPLYRLGSSVSAGPGQAFSLTYQASLPGATLVIFADRNSILRTTALPATSGNPVRYLVALAPGARVWGFQVTLAKAGTGELSLGGAGLGQAVHGFSRAGPVLSVDGSVEVRSASSTESSVRLPPGTQEQMGAGTWLLTLVLADPHAAASVTFSGGSAPEEFAVEGWSAPPQIPFSQASVGFLPATIAVRGDVTGIQISQVDPQAPIPADPGLILSAHPSQWRHPDYEVYSWASYPRVLIFDTLTYDVQDDFFNRLAFFVEKTGWVGQIREPSAYAGIHGYNAHDYKADDLARFFTEAARRAIALTTHETALLSLLLANGVVTRQDGGYAPADGSVLSISRSSNRVLRELLLTHEAFHGVYFSDPGFRDATAAVWRGLLPVERSFWQGYLASQGYDATDSYLMVNEFQAYLLQQERSGVPGRQAQFLARLSASSAQGARLAAKVTRSAPDSFLHAFDALDSALRARGGPPGGRVVDVQPVELR